MRTVRFSSTRATPLLTVALAAMLLIFAGSDTATAHEFNPAAGGSVSDPKPLAHADIILSFSPGGSLPTDDPPTVLFIPRQWGISNDAPTGAIGGWLDALATIGIFGMTPCTFPITFSPTMYVASTDTSNPTSALDLPGHPGGVGYSGQFVPDPEDPDGLYGGITRYPDFLNDGFTADRLREPLMRLWGGQNVFLDAISMNVLIYRPGQLPGYPPSLGYPVVFVFMNPKAPIDLLMSTITSDLCTPLSVVSTQFGISKDNPNTAADEEGYVLLTNPRAVGDYEFTLKTTSMPDADDPPEAEHGDGLENGLDTCPFDRNLGDSDGDGLDDACDPDPSVPSPDAPDFPGIPDEDQDNYGNLADNCPLVPNGIEIDPDSVELLQIGEFVFPYAEYWDLIGPDNQADTDGDDIGDACDPDPTTPTGRIYTRSLTFTIPICRHGVKLDNLGGPKKVKHPGARDYSVAVSNVSDTYSEDIQVALRVVPAGCATVNGEPDVNHEVVHVVQSRSGVADFAVDWSACEPGWYTVQADACHAGDPAPAGLFGVGLCPGDWDGIPDTNPSDDAPLSKTVTVGP